MQGQIAEKLLEKEGTPTLIFLALQFLHPATGSIKKGRRNMR